jgi:adenylosuccinate synthase
VPHATGTVIVGAQWGDEGKGKIVDLLAERFAIIARYQGGANAGHTVVVGDETFKFRLLPSGILDDDKLCVLGNGVVIDPEALCGELDDLEARNRSARGLRISGNAHLVMPWHRLLDAQSEVRLGALLIGTTKRGIGPAYADKVARLGIRVQDLLDRGILRQKVEAALHLKNEILERIYHLEPLDGETLLADLDRYAKRLEPYICDTSKLIDEALRADKAVLFEGAQGSLLDVDHGTYPFVTSSNATAGGALTGCGVGPTRIGAVIGVAKAYVTRVGSGPFPSEADSADNARLRDLGAEFGTVTGRERRCGWLDLVGLRFAARVNGLTELVVTKLDVLRGFETIPVCVAYQLPDGRIVDDFPAHQSDFHHARPVFETLPGFDDDVSTATTFDDLPSAARGYIAWIEQQLQLPVTLVGVGVRRDQILAPHGSDAVAKPCG